MMDFDPMVHGKGGGQSAPPPTPGLAAQRYNREERVEYARAQVVANLFMPGLMQHLQFAGDLAMIVFGWLSVGAEVFLRFNFGERYLSVLRLWFGFLLLVAIGVGGWVWGVALVATMPEKAVEGYPWWLKSVDWLYVLAVIGYGVAWYLHRRVIAQRNKRGELWHSMSNGVSWVLYLFEQRFAREDDADWRLSRYVEPIALMVAGALLTIATYVCVWQTINGTFSRYPPLNAWTTGVWLMFCGMALLVRSQIAYTQFRDRILDMVDARIEAEMFQPSLTGKPKTETAGFSVMYFPPAQVKEVEAAVPIARPDIADAVAARVAALTGATPPGAETETAAGETKTRQAVL